MAHCNYIVKVEVTLWVSAVWVNHSEKISAKGCLKLIKTRATVWYFSEGYQPKGVHDLIECWLFMKRISIPNWLWSCFFMNLINKLWKVFDIFEKYLSQKGLVVGLFPRLSKFDAERARWCQTFFVYLISSPSSLSSPTPSSSSLKNWQCLQNQL